ncbi:hypothetical protein LTR53_014530, partial [Teratosphaeriaceae sp. CCFEE 6253]
MATESVSASLPLRTATQTHAHPLAPLSADEIRSAVSIIRSEWPANVDLHFKAVTLEEPAKAEAVPYIEAEFNGNNLPSVDRKAFLNYYVRLTNKFHEAVVNLSSKSVDYNVRLGPNMHAPGDGEEIIAIERVALEDEGVQQEIAKLKLPEGTTIVVDPWIYGADGLNDDDRMWQTFLYMRDPENPDEADSNHYALPLTISPVVSSETMKVIRIDHLPTGKDNTIKETQPWQPKGANEYIPEAQRLRTDVKPLHVSQPEGASFTVAEQGTSQVIEWQKWSFRVGFNQREGM